jgi:hypothetical protein
MTVSRFAPLVFALAALVAAPAKAQLFWLPPDFSGPPLATYEAGIGTPLPGATADEQNAAIVWNMRSGLNVAALQCGFEPTLRTEQNYNAMLNNHGAEFASAFTKLTAYFARTNKGAALGQKALDKFGTKTYSGFSTVAAQKGFCTAAGRIGRISLFTPRGSFITFAKEHLRELRNSLILQGEQQFRIGPPYRLTRVPRFDNNCWKGENYNRSCGLQ